MEKNLSPEELYELAKLDIAAAAEANDEAIDFAKQVEAHSHDQVKVIATLACGTADLAFRQVVHLWAEMVYREAVRNQGD